MLDVGLSHPLQALVLDKQGDTRKVRPHVLGQRLDFLLDGFIECFDRPAQNMSIPKKVCSEVWANPRRGPRATRPA